MSTTVHVIGRHGADIAVSHIIPGSRIEVIDAEASAHVYLSLSATQLDNLIRVATAARDAIIAHNSSLHQDLVFQSGSNHHAPEGDRA